MKPTRSVSLGGAPEYALDEAASPSPAAATCTKVLLLAPGSLFPVGIAISS
jgi:hypothetical protein